MKHSTISEFLKAKKVKGKVLAAQIGVAPIYISEIKHGKRRPSR